MRIKILQLYLQIYTLLKGHLPPGTLVKFYPNLMRHGVIRERDPRDPDIDSFGVVLGGWSYYKHPGYQQSGSVVMINQVVYDLKNYDLEVISEAG